MVTRGDRAAAERLQRSAQIEGVETRALGNTGAAGGSGGEFAPPAWIISEWVNLIRPGRITADLFAHESVPAGVSSVNYPKITGGTTTAIQSTQNSALSQTDLTTSYVQTGFATIGGKQVVSQQLLDQTALNFDRVIMNDLAADYGQRVGAQIYLGTGTGSGTGAVINGLTNATLGTTQTWTQASPTAAGFYGQAGAMLSAFLTKRLAPPTCWIMAPRRWYWLASAADSTGRPLVVPVGNAYNPIATQTDVSQSQGMVGYFHGLPVYIDPQVPINIGGGTNQDLVYLVKADDLVLFESAPQAEVFRETYADSVGVLFRLFGYVGTILNRHTESLAVMTGTGLVTPTFAS
jgi:HK97 family phage major capsid protein